MKNQHVAIAHRGEHPNQVTTSFASPTREEAASWLFEELGGIDNLSCKDEALGCGHTATKATHQNGIDFGYILPSLFAEAREGVLVS